MLSTITARSRSKFRAYAQAGCHTYFNRKDHLWTLYAYENGTFHIPKTALPNMIYDSCNCGNLHLTILPTGDVFACRRVPNSKVGNVYSPIALQIYGYVKWSNTEIILNLKNVHTANYYLIVEDVLLWLMALLRAFMELFRNVERRL